MIGTRREFLTKGMAAATATAIFPKTATGITDAKSQASPEAILAPFKSLPGEVAVKIYSPNVAGKPEFLVQMNSAKQLFVGSAFKSFVLCEALRQADSPDVLKTLKTRQLDLDASVWSLHSSILNPPNLIGKVSERTALEAMIMHSDNTATDMCLKYAGPEQVREFIASIGLKSAMIPDSTRSFFGYMLGAKDYKSFTWDELCAAANQPVVNKPLNDVTTLACSADDLVSYYSRALQGEFFKHDATLNVFREILSIGDAIWLLPVPLGASAFSKGGNIDVEGFHALCAPGAMMFDDRWVYFCLTINWNAAEKRDPKTAQAFASAGSRALAMVKDALSG